MQKKRNKADEQAKSAAFLYGNISSTEESASFLSGPAPAPETATATGGTVFVNSNTFDGGGYDAVIVEEQ